MDPPDGGYGPPQTPRCATAPGLLNLEIKLWMFRYRLKFAAGPSGLDFFISSDMFYLELMLEPTGGVKDVKVHHEGKVEQVRKPPPSSPPPPT